MFNLSIVRFSSVDIRRKPKKKNKIGHVEFKNKNVEGGDPTDTSYLRRETNFLTKNRVQMEKRRSDTQMMAASAVFWAGVLGFSDSTTRKSLEPETQDRSGETGVKSTPFGEKASEWEESHLSPGRGGEEEKNDKIGFSYLSVFLIVRLTRLYLWWYICWDELLFQSSSQKFSIIYNPISPGIFRYILLLTE